MNIEEFRKMTDSLKLYHRITNEKYRYIAGQTTLFSEEVD